MLAPARTRRTSLANRMLAMADRLFTDFDMLPVRTVFDAISASRATLVDETGRVPAPERIEVLARERLGLQRDQRAERLSSGARQDR